MLAVALLNGLLYMFLAPPWQGPDENAHFTYAALLDRLDLDDRRVQAPEMHAQAEADKLQVAIATSMSLSGFTRYVSWHSAPGAPVGLDPLFFQELRQPPAYYWLCAAALKGARAIGISADPYTDPVDALRLMRGVSLALSLGVVALAWLLAALISPGFGRRSWLRLLLPLGVALFPMRAFVDATVNNDVLAELAVSALFVAVAALLRWPTGWRGVALAALAVALTVAGSPTKGTAPAASVPLLALGLLVWLGMLLTKLAERWRNARDRRRGSSERMATGSRAWTIGIPLGMALLMILAGSGLTLSAFERSDAAVGWHTSFSPIQRVNRVATGSAHEGSYVIELGTQSGSNGGNSVSQALLSLAQHPAMKLTISGWVRLLPGTAVNPSAPARVVLSLLEGQRTAGSSEVSLDNAGTWMPVSIEGKISESAEQVLMTVTANSAGPGAPVQIDDFSLTVTGSDGLQTEPASRPILLNPSAEEAATGLRSWASRLLPSEARQIADVIVNPQTFDKGALSAYYAEMETRSFWGLFGWVSIPLPEALYTLLDVLALLALGGLLYLAVERVGGRWSYQEWLGLISLGALAGAVLIGFAKQMMFLATLNSAAYPQGRYLFVLIVPIIWLLVAGWSGLWSFLVRLYRLNMFSKLRRLPASAGNGGVDSGTARDVATPNARGGILPWGAWLLLVGFSLFNLYSLLALLVPYYYG